MGETPCHQVPRLILRGDKTGGLADVVDTVAGGEVARNEIDAGRNGFGHVVGERPVAGDLKIGRGLVQDIDPMAEPVAERVAVIIHPHAPVRLVFRFRDGFESGLLFERLDRRLAVVGRRRPAFAVDPDAVDAVIERELLELGNHQFIDVAAERRRHAGVSGTVGIDARPLGMKGDGAGIPDAGIVHIESHAPLGGHAPPDAQGVAGDIGTRVADLGRVARNAGMPFAVDLDEVWIDRVEEPADHLVGRVGADMVVQAAVEIEMDAEEGVFPFQAGRFIGGG